MEHRIGGSEIACLKEECSEILSMFETPFLYYRVTDQISRMYQAIVQPKLTVYWVNEAYLKALVIRIWNLVLDPLYHVQLARERPKRVPWRPSSSSESKCEFDKMVHFFCNNFPIFMRRYQTSILGHIQKDFFKNINGQSIQPLFLGSPPLLLGHG